MRDFKVDKKVKYFLFFMLFFPLIGLFVWIFWKTVTDDSTDREVFLKYETSTEFIGKVDSIYRLKMSHNTLTLKSDKHNFYVPSDWESKFQLGDSISKKKGELIVEHYRNGELIEVLDYHDIAKHMK